MKKKKANRLEWIFLISITILLIVLLVSCKSNETTIKKNTKSNEVIQEDVSSSINTNINTQREENTKEVEVKDLRSNKFENVLITQKTVEYDTDKMIDELTGKYPIKKETTTVIGKQSKQETKQSDQKTKELSNIETIQEQVKQIAASKTQKSLFQVVNTETKKKSAFYIIQKILLALGCACIGFALFSVYKWYRKIKK